MGTLPRILLLGEQGQLAWELKRSLASLGETVVAGRASAGHRADLTRPGEVARLIKSLRPDWVVNAAAYTQVDKAEEQDHLAAAINGIAPGVIAEAARACRALLVHFSSDYVFDGARTTPYTEQDRPNPQGVYGRSKLEGERNIRAAGGDHVILRTSWIYANRGRNFVCTIRRLAREREELRVVDDQRGAPTWARHVADATAQILMQQGVDRERWAARSGIYHLTADGETTWYEFASRIVEYQRRQEPVAVRAIRPIAAADLKRPAARPRYSVLDNGKLRGTFHISLPRWDVALAQAQEELTIERI